jgi:hypothetical protein
MKRRILFAKKMTHFTLPVCVIERKLKGSLKRLMRFSCAESGKTKFRLERRAARQSPIHI